jgi:hypothetical protein
MVDATHVDGQGSDHASPTKDARMADAYTPIRPPGWISVGFSIEEHDQFAAAFNNVERYLRYLDVIRYRVIASSERHRQLVFDMSLEMPHVNGTFNVTPKYSALFYESRNVTPIIQLDIEAFYLNARILLDRVWDFIHFCFRGNDNLSVQGFTNFRNNFMRFAAASNLTYSQTLLTQSDDLHARVVTIRDKFITHNNNIRTMGATITQPTKPGSMPHVQFAKHKNGTWIYSAETENLDTLFADVYGYVDHALSLIDDNRDSLRFAFEAEGYDEKLHAASRPISKATFSTVTVREPNSKTD